MCSIALILSDCPALLHPFMSKFSNRVQCGAYREGGHYGGYLACAGGPQGRSGCAVVGLHAPLVGAGSFDNSGPNRHWSAGGCTVAFANHMNALTLAMMQLLQFKERQDEVFIVLVGMGLLSWGDSEMQWCMVHNFIMIIWNSTPKLLLVMKLQKKPCFSQSNYGPNPRAPLWVIMTTTTTILMACCKDCLLMSMLGSEQNNHVRAPISHQPCIWLVHFSFSSSCLAASIAQLLTITSFPATSARYCIYEWIALLTTSTAPPPFLFPFTHLCFSFVLWAMMIYTQP